MGRPKGSKNKPKSNDEVGKSDNSEVGKSDNPLWALGGMALSFCLGVVKDGINRHIRHKKVEDAIKDLPTNELYPTEKDYAVDVSENEGNGTFSEITPDIETDIAKIVGYAIGTGQISKNHTGFIDCLFQKFDGEDIESFAKTIGSINSIDDLKEQVENVVKIKLSTVPPTIFCFAAAFATFGAFHYLTSSRLNDLSKQIESIKGLMVDEDFSKMKATFNVIKDISRQLSNGNETDIERRLNDESKSTYQLREKYRLQVSKVIVEPESFFLNDKREVNKWLEKIERSNLKEYMLIALQAEYGYAVCIMMKICYLCRLGKVKDAKGYIDEIPKSDCDLGSEYAEHYHKIRATVIKNIDILEKDESISATCGETIQKIRTYFDDIEHPFRECQAKLLPRLKIKIEDGKPVGVYAF